MTVIVEHVLKIRRAEKLQSETNAQSIEKDNKIDVFKSSLKETSVRCGVCSVFAQRGSGDDCTQLLTYTRYTTLSGSHSFIVKCQLKGQQYH